MAEKTLNKKVEAKNSPQDEFNQPVEPKKTRKKMLVFAAILGLLMLAGVGFGLGIYLRLVDVQGLADRLKLSDYPVIGRYFTKQQTNFEPVETDNSGNATKQASEIPAQVPGVNPQSTQVASSTPANPIDAAENAKRIKAQQQEEAKRIGKLARLYGGMKPDEAVAVLNELDDDTVIAILGKMEEEQVSKIIPLFDTKRAARLTDTMFKGQKKIN